MSVYGYAIAPINYGMKATILDNSSKIHEYSSLGSIKELILVNVTNNPLVNEAVFVFLSYKLEYQHDVSRRARQIVLDSLLFVSG